MVQGQLTQILEEGRGPADRKSTQLKGGEAEYWRVRVPREF